MDLKAYSVDVSGDEDYYYVFAYSPEHAIVETAEYLSQFHKTHPDEFNAKEDVRELENDEMMNIIIDFIFPLNAEKTISLSEVFRDAYELVEKEAEFYGVVGTNQF